MLKNYNLRNFQLSRLEKIYNQLLNAMANDEDEIIDHHKAVDAIGKLGKLIKELNEDRK